MLTPLDADPEPASLTELRSEVEKLLPEVEIADLPLEVHGWTGFLDEYTHMAGTETRDPGLPETLSGLLVSESCNVGLTPVADETRRPLKRERLNWVAHNHLRSATHAAANTRLVDYHTPLPLAQAWGGGEMASADGMRFVIPVSTIHAAYNPRYFGRQRGSTLYSWMADSYTVFAQKLIPGTQRDSLHVLDGLLANQTGIRPEMVSTDTAGASEIVFALTWALGYRWAPRLADLPDQRLWRIDPHARYGPLNVLARHRINTRLIAENWDEICRLAASLRASTVIPSAILRTLQRGPSPSSLARALAELGRVIKTLHVLEYAHDPAYRRTIHHLLSRGERPQLPRPRRLPRPAGPAPQALPGRAGKPARQPRHHDQHNRAMADPLHAGRPRPSRGERIPARSRRRRPAHPGAGPAAVAGELLGRVRAGLPVTGGLGERD